MAGAAVNVALGDWLVKGEAARFEGFMFNNSPGVRKSRFDALAGVEYSGITDNTFSLEFANRRILDFNPALKAAGAHENEYQTALRYQGNFIHDTVHAVAVASFFGLGGEDGAFGRLSIKYDVNDSLSATAGVVWYQSGDNWFFRKIGDNDRLFLDIKYSF